MPPSIPVELFEKRRLLYAKGAERRQTQTAAALLAEGRLAEACEVLERCRDEALLGKVRAAAVAAGDTFALHRATAVTKVEATPDEWRAVAGKARTDGRFYEAIRALEKAGDAEAAEALRLEKHPTYRPFKPHGK